MAFTIVFAVLFPYQKHSYGRNFLSLNNAMYILVQISCSELVIIFCDTSFMLSEWLLTCETIATLSIIPYFVF